jgi:hypothetical protein
MPGKINMFLSNGNIVYNNKQQINIANLASYTGSTAFASNKTPSALNAPILARVFNVRPGCGSCGRH